MKIALQENIDKQLLLNIVNYFHPDLNLKNHDKIKYSIKYNWVIIEFRIKGYGYISLGLYNHHCIKPLWGPISKERVKELFDENLIGYKIWRFIDDVKYNVEGYIREDNSFFKDVIPLPSQEEYYDYYMKD